MDKLGIFHKKQTYSRKTNKLQNIYTIGRGSRKSPSRNGKLTILKLKSSRLSLILDGTMIFVMDKSKSKMRASVSKEFALFN